MRFNPFQAKKVQINILGKQTSIISYILCFVEYQKEDIETTLQYGISTSMQIDPTQYALLITQGKYFRDKLSQQQVSVIDLKMRIDFHVYVCV